MKREQAPWVDEEERHKMTLEGLADVDAGRVMDHETVRVWADNLPISHLPPI